MLDKASNRNCPLVKAKHDGLACVIDQSWLEAKLIGAQVQRRTKRDWLSLVKKSKGFIPTEDDALSLQEVSCCDSSRRIGKEQIRPVWLDNSKSLGKSISKMMEIGLAEEKELSAVLLQPVLGQWKWILL